MAQFLLNGTTQVVENEEEGRSPTTNMRLVKKGVEPRISQSQEGPWSIPSSDKTFVFHNTLIGFGSRR